MQYKYLDNVKKIYKRVQKLADKTFYVLVALAIVGLGVDYAFAQNGAQTSTEFTNESPQQATIESLNQSQGGLLNPEQAEAGFIWDAGKIGTNAIFCALKDLVGNECPINNDTWSTRLVVQGITANIVSQAICHKTYNVAVEDTKADASKGCADVEEFKSQNAYIKSPSDMGFRLYPYGAAGILASSLDYAVEEAPPPTNLALFINDATKDNILGVQPAYAQNAFQGDFRNFVLNAWKLTRNLALALMGVVIGISALMIMFRAQIAPRVSVSIYNVLPMIPIGLGLILLSYPIITLLLSLVWPLKEFAVYFAGQIINTSFFAYTIDGTSTGEMVVRAFNAIFALIVVVLGLGTVFGVILIIILLLLVLFILISIFITYIQVYLSMMFNTIVAPLVVLISMLPGRSGMLINFAKRLVVDVLTIPVLWFSLLIGIAIMGYTPGGNFTIGIEGSGALGVNKWAVFVAHIAKYFIGFGIIWKSRNTRKALEGMLGVGSIWGGEDKKR